MGNSFRSAGSTPERLSWSGLAANVTILEWGSFYGADMAPGGER